MAVDWKLIVERYGKLVWSTAYRLVNHHADAYDCYQETFLDAFHLSEKEPIRDWPSLLCHLAVIRSMKLLRTRSRHSRQADGEANLDEVCDPIQGPSDAAEADELADQLRAALVQLPPQQAEVFYLNCIEHLSYGEVGDRLQMTENAVGVVLHRARRRLRELLIRFDAGARREK
jgi:RNA polymerase sigma-70 factor (ECF subfamily)